MLEFKKITLGDKNLFDKYLKAKKFLSSEYSFTNLYMWRDYYHTDYCIYKGALIIRKRDTEGYFTFLEPVGYKEEELNEIIELFITFKNQIKTKNIFDNLTKDFADKISLYKEYNFIVSEDRDSFDYIYEKEKLSMLSGKKYHGKKNHYKSFIKNYNYTIMDMRLEDVSCRIKETLTIWHNKKNFTDERLKYEMKVIPDLIKNIHYLDLKGIAVEVDNEIAAFALGEKVGKEMAVIHVEKADIKYNGVYSFINKTFLDQCFKEVKFVNREQDLGIEGLRKAKESYHPIFMEKKYKGF